MDPHPNLPHHDLLDEIFSPRGALPGRTFAGRAVFYGLTATGLVVLVLLVATLGQIAGLRPLTHTGRALLTGLAAAPFVWAFTVNAIRRLRDAGHGYLGLALMAALTAPVLVYDAVLAPALGELMADALTLGAAINANLAALAIWAAYGAHLALLPSRRAAPVLASALKAAHL